MLRMHRDRITGRKKTLLSFQRTVQVASAALCNGYALGFSKGKIFTGKSKAFCVPVLNCYSCPGALGACPIGSLQFALGGVNRHFPFYVLGVLMLFGVTLGRLVCGLLCPFGLVQDLLHKIPLPKYHIPKKIDRPLRYLKYVVLAATILLPIFRTTTAGIAPPYFCKYICPAGTLGAGIPLVSTNPDFQKIIGFLFDWKIMVLVVIALLSMLIQRPFCRYLCPLGAFYSVFNRFSFYQMQLKKDKCIGCQKCHSACPMAIEVTENINSAECIRCGKCKSVCPANAITSGFTK